MNLACRDYQEKRNFLRIKVETPVEVVQEQRPALRGICHNLSGGGMLISLDTAMPVGSHMEVTIRSEYGHSPVLKALAQVQRVGPQAGPNADDYLLGLKIVRILN